MNNERPPFWHGGIDRWVLIGGGVLAVILGIWAISSLRKPTPTPTPPPTIIAEASPAPSTPEPASVTPVPTTAATEAAVPPQRSPKRQGHQPE